MSTDTSQADRPSWLDAAALDFDGAAKQTQTVLFDDSADAMGTPAMFDGLGA
jgi:hypothetical protein